MDDMVCSTCLVQKPVFMFGVRTHNSRAMPVYYRTCERCRERKGKASSGPVENGKASPTAWILPVDDRPEEDRALDGLLRLLPAANDGPLRWVA